MVGITAYFTVDRTDVDNFLNLIKMQSPMHRLPTYIICDCFETKFLPMLRGKVDTKPDAKLLRLSSLQSAS